MDIVKSASAGTMESSDVYVEIEPGCDGVQVELESVVKLQFGDAIEAAVRDVLAEQGVDAEAVLEETIAEGAVAVYRIESGNDGM